MSKSLLLGARSKPFVRPIFIIFHFVFGGGYRCALLESGEASMDCWAGGLETAIRPGFESDPQWKGKHTIPPTKVSQAAPSAFDHFF